MSAAKRARTNGAQLPTDVLGVIAGLMPLMGAGLARVCRAWHDALAPEIPVRLRNATQATRHLLLRANVHGEPDFVFFLARTFPNVRSIVLHALTSVSDELRMFEINNLVCFLKAVKTAGFVERNVSFLVVLPYFFRDVTLPSVPRLTIHERPYRYRDVVGADDDVFARAWR